MVELSCKYMGMKLKNPIIVSSCGLTDSYSGIKKCADAGAGAVIVKSLFEEQIESETDELIGNLWLNGHTEAFDYVRGMSMALGPKEYLELIRKTRKEIDIPIIASLNCVSPRWWLDYASQIEASGADGIELNISILPSDPNRDCTEIEKIYLSIVESVKSRINIPVSVKIGPYFSSIASVVNELNKIGVSSIVMFNRFYRLNIDIEKMELSGGNPLSTPDELNLPLRWISILSGRIDCDLAASTGIHDGEDVIKFILAGAKVVQICSTLYLNGIEYIGQMIDAIEKWMVKKGYNKLSDYRGILSLDEGGEVELYERLQYIKAISIRN